ncbi:MAG: 30S ribosomal protein S16 [Anaerolineae bacterium]|nr:30S ribosomal protein S16 [Anaerolineae bacterium]
MVRIRLRRVGLKKQPSYRIVVANQRSPRDGRNIEVIGFYNPRTQPATMTIQEDRALYWLSVGAQPSDAVEVILRNLGTLDRYARLVKGEAMEALVAEAAAEAEARGLPSQKTTGFAPKPKAAPAADAVDEVVAAVAEAEAVEEAEAE